MQKLPYLFISLYKKERQLATVNYWSSFYIMENGENKIVSFFLLLL